MAVTIHRKAVLRSRMISELLQGWQPLRGEGGAGEEAVQRGIHM